MSDNRTDEKEVEKPIVAKTAVDLQRLKLMKLMKNPEKPVLLPERPKSKNTPTVPEFVRNVMGSSAGAGSGEFHVYRHLRRKEYSRQKFIQEKGKKELLDEEYHRKLEDNRKAAEIATAKKRAKRLMKKQKKRRCKRSKPTNESNNSQSDHTSTDEEDSDAEGNSETITRCGDDNGDNFKGENVKSADNNEAKETNIPEATSPPDEAADDNGVAKENNDT